MRPRISICVGVSVRHLPILKTGWNWLYFNKSSAELTKEALLSWYLSNQQVNMSVGPSVRWSVRLLARPSNAFIKWLETRKHGGSRACKGEDVSIDIHRMCLIVMLIIWQTLLPSCLLAVQGRRRNSCRDCSSSGLAPIMCHCSWVHHIIPDKMCLQSWKFIIYIVSLYSFLVFLMRKSIANSNFNSDSL